MKLAITTKGFTLIELVMVIVILGILAAVAVLKFADTTGDANRAVFRNDMALISGGIAVLQAQNLIAEPGATNGGYPQNLESGSIPFEDVIQGGIAERWTISSSASGFGSAAGVGGTSVYAFTNDNFSAVPDTTATYDNFLGTIK